MSDIKENENLKDAETAQEATKKPAEMSEKAKAYKKSLEEADKKAKPELAKGESAIMGRTKTEAKENLKTEDNLELHGMSAKERRQIKRERLKQNTQGMTKSEKIGYYVYYFKWPVIITLIAVVAAISLIISIYQNNKPVALGYVIVNGDTETLDTTIIDVDYMEYYGFDNSYQIRAVTDDMELSLELYEEEYSSNSYATKYNSFPTLCWNGYYDVIITDSTGLEYLTSMSIPQPLANALTADLMNALTSECPELITESINVDGDMVEYAIDISGTEFAESLNLGYDEVYVCFTGITESNYMNAKRFCKFVLGIDVATE